jgi:hypothetical protein
MAALNAGDEPALLSTLHFPHYRLAGGRMRVWEQPGAYLADFLVRAGADWHHSEWDFRRAIAAGRAKVHLDVQFTRYRIDNSVIGSFRSLWIVTESGAQCSDALK